jgi:hypothetical protein
MGAFYCSAIRPSIIFAGCRRARRLVRKQLSAQHPIFALQCNSGPHRLVFQFHLSPVNQPISQQHAQYTCNQSQGLQSGEHKGIHRTFNGTSLTSTINQTVEFTSFFHIVSVSCTYTAQNTKAHAVDLESRSLIRCNNGNKIRVKPADQEHPEGLKNYCSGIR